MIGDSYLDYPAWSNVAPDLFMDARNAGSLGANATYREYQLGGAAMNYGTLNLNIPYQYETTAKGDLSFTNPTDIDTIIMDGGGNDVIIDNQECLTARGPPSGSDTCSMAIQGTVARAKSLLQEMAADHVKHIVYFFYPHLDPAGGGYLLPTPAPEVNATLDYAYPLAEQICCGSSFTATATSNTCTGNTAGTQCTFSRHATRVRRPHRRLHQVGPRAPDAGRLAGDRRSPLERDGRQLRRAVGARPQSPP